MLNHYNQPYSSYGSYYGTTTTSRPYDNVVWVNRGTGTTVSIVDDQQSEEVPEEEAAESAANRFLRWMGWRNE
jgi:hypothetical protein